MIVFAREDQLDLICRFYQDVTDDLEKRVNYPRWIWGAHPDRSGIEQAIENSELILYRPDSFEQLLKSKGIENWPYPFAGAAILNSSWIDGGQISWQGTHFMALHLFAIHPALSKASLADLFLEELLNHAKEQNCDSVRLDLIEGNWPADHLYLRHGFEDRGKGVFQPEGEPILPFEYREFMIG